MADKQNGKAVRFAGAADNPGLGSEIHEIKSGIKTLRNDVDVLKNNGKVSVCFRIEILIKEGKTIKF